ncbi:MAG: hypothetical protein KDC76_13730, partial [Bacteroidetes bacterium]|nr:hypothetical protein [Bacteroidota bacterium]
MRKFILVSLAVSFTVLFSTCKKEPSGPDVQIEPTITFEDVASVLTTQERASLRVEQEFQTESDEVAVLFNVAKWLLNQPDVQQVFMEDYALEVHYTSGIVSDLVLEYTNMDGRAYFRGGGADQGSKLEPFTSGEISLKAMQDKIIENKKVLVFIPFDLQFNYIKSEVEKKIKAFPLDLDVTVVTGTDADLDVVRTFNQYGLIVLNTHGQPDGFEVRTNAPLFSSARIIDTTVVVPASLVEQQALAAGISLADIENGAIKLNAKVTIESDTNKIPLGFKYVYSIQVTDKFIRKIPRLNDAVVFGNYCFSGYTADGPSTRNIPEAFKS